jgi:prepilin-type N-terminal cleavage/methylation domain-containing protein
MNKSFTLIEILVVIVVIGVLSALILVGISSISSSANIAKGQAFSNSLRNSLLMNLISEWKFDEGGTSQTIADAWRSNNLTLGPTVGVEASDPTWTTSGCISKNCLSFDGNDDYVFASDNDTLDVSDALTIEIWIKTRQAYTDKWREIIGKSNYSDWGIFAEWSAQGGNPRFEIDNGGSRYTVAGPSFSTMIDRWTYLAGTYTKNEGILKIYVNGAHYNSNSIGAGKTIDTNTEVLQIGGYTNAIFNGYIDEAKVYNEIIPAFKIKDNYYSGLNKLLANNGIDIAEYNQRLMVSK